jgi:phytoene dehydrogenase-like protein
MKNIVIVESGIGGLTAANLLARKGHKMTLFEAHSAPGGYTAGVSDYMQASDKRKPQIF